MRRMLLGRMPVVLGSNGRRVVARVSHAQGSAAFLLERYEEAEAALLEGLSLEPGNAQLQAQLQAVRQALDQSGGEHRLVVAHLEQQQQQQQQQQQAPQAPGRCESAGLQVFHR